MHPPITARKRAIDRLRRNMIRHGIEATLVTHPPNLRYLFGFTGSTGTALVDLEASYLFLDSRYTLQGEQECVGCAVITAKPAADKTLLEKISSLKHRRIGIEAAHLNLNRYLYLRRRLPKRVRLIQLPGLVEELRIVKTIEEIEEIRRTLKLTTQAFDAIIPAVKPGIREKDLAAELEYQLRKRGARKTSFDTIVASGPRSAMPHGLASDRKLQNNEFVVFDFGAYREGYASDVTRTLFLGKPSSEQRRIYRTVLEAVLRTEEGLRPKLLGRTVDELARSHIERGGFGGCFGHGTGHGIGLEVHEEPFIHARQQRRIRRNMVFTVEPGIYLPDKGGVRIEDIVRVSDTGCEVLTEYSKELIVL